MARTVVVRYTTRPEAAEENARLVAAVYEELDRTRPPGFRYATSRLADGVSFVHFAVLEGDDNPLDRSPAFAAFQEAIGDRLAYGPRPAPGTLVGAYGFSAG
jgi:hypothetical protein